MNPNQIAILVDSCTDVPEASLQQHGIYWVPITIIYKDREYRDKIDITAQEVYDRLEVEVPRTSQPNGDAVREALERIRQDGFSRVLIITIAGALLGHLANQAWGTNFWFLNVGAPDSPLEAIQYVAGPFHVPGADRGHARRLDSPPPALDAPRTRPAPVTLRLDSRSYSVSISPNDNFCAATDPSTS